MLLIGVVLGIGLAFVVARVAGPYFSDVFSFGPGLEGEVVDKELEADRLLLRVSTWQGVLVAVFTQNINEIDMLVERGDIVALSIDRYRPFVDNPGIESVQRSAPASERPATETMRARTAYVREMEAQLEAWEADISKLRARASKPAQGSGSGTTNNSKPFRRTSGPRGRSWMSSSRQAMKRGKISGVARRPRGKISRPPSSAPCPDSWKRNAEVGDRLAAPLARIALRYRSYDSRRAATDSLMR